MLLLFLDEISVRAPRKLFIFIIVFFLLDQNIHKNILYNFGNRTTAPVQTVRLAVTDLTGSVFVEVYVSGRSPHELVIFVTEKKHLQDQSI